MFVPYRDVAGAEANTFGKIVMEGNLADVQTYLAAEKLSSNDIFNMKWGRTQVPIFNMIHMLIQVIPESRSEYLAITRHLIEVCKVPVDGTDLSGTTALSHCFSTKPATDLEYAEMLTAAGGDVNHRNRYGGTVAHEIVQVYDFGNPAAVSRAGRSLQFFLSHGGNLDIKDGDKATARASLMSVARSGNFRALTAMVSDEDRRRAAIQEPHCALCGGTEDVMMCTRCKKAYYCRRERRQCQALHWPEHKKACSPPN